MSNETAESRSFDQIVKGSVSIEKLSKHKYKITFRKIEKFLVYQVWDRDSVKLNNDRLVDYMSAKKWVSAFKKINKQLNFTPTTIFETEEDDVYAFVIHKACMNSDGKVVFTVSTKEISLGNNVSNKMIQLPSGDVDNVRLDIDTWNDVGGFFKCLVYCP